MKSAGAALFSNQAGNTNSAAANWPGGEGAFVAMGTFDGGTVKLQFQGPDGSTWIDYGAPASLTANGVGIFKLPPSQIRGVITGGAAPTGIYASVSRILY